MKPSPALCRRRSRASTTEFDYPSSTNTTALGVNKNDEIVGVYVDSANQMHGFTLTSPLNNAKWHSIDDPNGVGTTTINGVNDNGDLVGFYIDGAGNTDGFLAKPATSTGSQQHASGQGQSSSNLIQWFMSHL